MTRLAALALLTLVSAFAQPSNAPPVERRVVEVKNLRGPRLDQAVKLLTTFLMPGGDANSFPELNAVVLRGPAETVAAAETMLKKFDVPVQSPRTEAGTAQYQLRLHLVQAFPEEGKGGPVAPDIASAVEQMRKSFVYKSYRSIETAVVQFSPGTGPRMLGTLPGLSAGADSTWSAEIRDIQSLEEGRVLSIRQFEFRLNVPRPDAPMHSYQMHVSTSLSLRTGQKVVVGKLSASQTTPAIFLILTAEPIS